MEIRDDRVIAAPDPHDGDDRFRMAFLLRAVTPGIYRLPGAYVEDMYRPQISARMNADIARVDE